MHSPLSFIEMPKIQASESVFQWIDVKPLVVLVVFLVDFFGGVVLCVDEDLFIYIYTLI